MLYVLGITGLAGSGKDETADYLANHGFRKRVFSDVVREEANRRSLLKSGQSLEDQKYVLSQVGELMRKESGKMGILGEKLVDMIKRDAYERNVVSGFRSVEEVTLFRNNFENFYLLLVEADPKIRFARRSLEDPSATLEAMAKRDKENVENMGLGKVMKMADFTLHNNGTKEELYASIEDLVKKLKI
jgi:dephospho-CoA kinase